MEPVRDADYLTQAARQHGVLTRRQAAEAGLSRSRLATLVRYGVLDEPAPGVLRVRGSISTWQQSLMIAVLAGGGATVSHRAAARLHRLDGFQKSRHVEVSVPRHQRHRVSGVVTHHVVALDDEDLTVVDGIPCTSLARTLTDLGAVATQEQVQRALTDARRRQIDLVALRATAERLARPGPSGTATLLRLLDAVPHEGRVPDSWFEELLARCVADPSLPQAIPQYEIRNDDGILVAVADLAMPTVRLGLEGHSRQFHFGPLQEPLDEERDLRVAACGWELVYLGWYATRKPEEVIRTLRAVVRARRQVLRSAA